jgi:hypothetical protein
LKLDALGQHRRMVAGEIVGFEKQATRPPVWSPIARNLARRRPWRAADARALHRRRRDDDPALAAAEIDILGQREAEFFDVPGEPQRRNRRRPA